MPHADLLVVGGGLAGVLVAEVGAAMGREVTVLEHGQARASDTPCALVHPFVGGSFRPREHIEEAWNDARAWFGARDRFLRHAIVRRVLPQTRAGDRLSRTWPLIEPLARKLFAHVVAPGEKRWVEYGPVFAVDLRGLLEAERAALQARGVIWRSGLVDALQRQRGPEERWAARLQDGTSITANTVVLAAGAGARDLLEPWTSVEPLALVEGSLACAPARGEGRFTIHGGHASSSPAALAWGATYRMHGGDARDPTDALQAIDARLRAAGADLPPMDRATIWTAVRLVDEKTRRPWVGRVEDGLLTFCGFGSQGCLWGPWSTRGLVALLRAK